jgi:DNA-binding PadR family transcriptional regulator
MESKKISFRVKSKILLYDILIRIDRNESQDEIRRWYGWSKQRLYYYISKLKKAGIIKIKVRDKIALYELTEKGKVFFKEHIQYLNSSIRLHNIEYIANIESLGTITHEKEWKLRGILNRLKRETNCTMVWNNNTMRFIVSSLFGTNAFQLMEDSKNIVRNIIKNLELEFGLKIGELTLNRKPHFAIKTPIAEQFSNNLEITTDEGKIDASEGYGEIDYFTPESADAYINMPKTLKQLDQKLVPAIDRLTEQINLHLEVLDEMRLTLKEIRESLKK